ncbi:MAG: glycosyltransferase family 9 protein [Deltaproteobacteria bacterium]|nr:glycosyltransferase family 9 protein [Deltaproteobacteria bacterium]
MIRISPHRIVDRKKRALALMAHYILEACFILYRFLTFRPFREKGGLPIGQIKKVLLIRIDGLGDVAMSAPVFGSLKEIFPDARITLLAASWSRDMVEVIPGLDEIIFFDAPWMVKGRDEKKENVFKVIRKLRKERFDLAVDFRGDFRNNILMSVSNARYRLGFNITGCGFLLTHVVPCADDHHPTRMCLSVMRYLNPKCTVVSNPLWTTEKDRECAVGLLRENGLDPGKDGLPVVVIHPGAKWYGRRWMPERYAEIGDRLIEDYRANVIFSGAPGDAMLVRHIADMMRHKAVITAGRTSLRQFLALLEESDLFIGVDSGPMHMAAAMGTRVIVMFGPALPEAVGPYGLGHIVVTRQREFPCSPCAQTECKLPEDSCMQAITVDDIWAAVRTQLSAVSSERHAQRHSGQNRIHNIQTFHAQSGDGRNL